MDILSIVELVQSVPLFIWIILVIIIFVLFSDKQLWEYEARFVYTNGIGEGDLEIEYYKKAKGSVDLELFLEEAYQQKELEIFLENDLLFTVPAESNNDTKLHFHEPYTLSEPHEGMKVHIKCDNKILFTAPLLMD